MNRTMKVMCSVMFVGAGMLMTLDAKAQTDADKKFLSTAAQSDQNEIALSKLAVEKASNPDVKAFAEKMVTEHEQMTAGMKPFADKWGLAAPSGPDSSHQKEWNKLNGMRGEAFDKEYMSDMVTDHAKAYSAFTKEAEDTKDPEFKQAVLKGKTEVAAHKNMAYDLKKTV